MITTSRPFSPRSALALSMVAATATALPIGLTGGFVVQVRTDLQMGLDVCGLLVGLFFVASALAAFLLAPIVERIGAKRGIQLAAAASAVALAVIGTSVSSAQLGIGMGLGGFGHGLIHPATNRLLSRLVRRRLGLAMGLKLTAMPAASLIGGLAVPTLSSTLGWRGSFAAMTVAVLLVLLCAQGLTAPTTLAPSPPARRESRGIVRRQLLPVAAAAGLATAAAASIAIFLVDAGVSIGLTENAAATVLAVSSMAGLLGRVGAGWLVDRPLRMDAFTFIAATLVVGAVGYAALASPVTAVFLLGAFLGYTGGSAWNGVLHHAIVTRYPDSPATATGIAQVGFAVGAGIGPIVFGLLVEHFSYTVGWLALALGCLAAAVLAPRAGRMAVGVRRRGPHKSDSNLFGDEAGHRQGENDGYEAVFASRGTRSRLGAASRRLRVGRPGCGGARGGGARGRADRLRPDGGGRGTDRCGVGAGVGRRCPAALAGRLPRRAAHDHDRVRAGRS
jgi:predicted MFS family arabinose efflux permease